LKGVSAVTMFDTLRDYEWTQRLTRMQNELRKIIST